MTREIAHTAGRDGVRRVVWQDRKYRIEGAPALAALGLTAATPVTVPDVVVASLPDGPALAAPVIPGSGEVGPPIAGSRHVVGTTVFRQVASNGTRQLFVLGRDGLEAIGSTDFALLAASGATVVELTAAEVASAPKSSQTSLLDRLPDLMSAPTVDLAEFAVCLRQLSYWGSVSSAMALAPGDRVPLSATGAVVPPGKAMMVVALPLPKSPTRASYYLIADQARKYPVSDDATMQALGLGGLPAVGMPVEVLSLLSDGPTLSRLAALS